MTHPSGVPAAPSMMTGRLHACGRLLDGGPGGRHGRAAKDKMNPVVTNYTMVRTSGHVQMAAFDPRMRKAWGE